MTLEFAFAPPFAQAETEVEFAFFRALAAAQDEQIVGPRQLSHQWCDFLVEMVDAVELPHPKQISPGEAFEVGMLPCEVTGKFIHNAVDCSQQIRLGAA